MKVAVTSRSFSKDPFLRQEVLKHYPDALFNDTGKNLAPEALVPFLKGREGVIVGLEKMNDEILAQLPELKIISKYGVGLDNVDFEAVEKRGIRFAHAPGVNKRGVAELALSMILVLMRKSYEANQSMRQGEWNPLFGNNLTGKKVGILGLGHVGKDLCKLLAPFDCEISCSDINPDHEFIKNHKLQLLSLEELFSRNDVVSIHIPFNQRNKNIVSENLLSLMPKHSILINTARGGLVDESALYQKLKKCEIAASGCDVFLKEPYQEKDLLSLPNFFSTPHIGGSSVESVKAMGLAAIEGLSKAKLIRAEDFI